MLQPPHGPEEPVQPLISVDEAIPDGTVFSYQVGKSIAQLVAVADRRDEFRRDGTVVGVSREPHPAGAPVEHGVLVVADVDGLHVVEERPQ